MANQKKEQSKQKNFRWEIPLSRPHCGKKEYKAVKQVLKSGWLTMGPQTEKLEKKMAEYLGVKYAFALSSCTAALHIANLALGIGQNDSVICPALTFVASANASTYCGAKLIFADSISHSDLCLDPRDVEKKITADTKAITLVHYGGFSCDMEAFLALAKKHKLAIIEDCAHAPGAAYRFADGSLKKPGSMGDFGCFSFYGNKNMTCAEGGLLVCNDSALAEKVKLLRCHGMTALSFDRFKGHASSYDVLLPGFNYRLDDIRASIALAQFSRLEKFNQKRRKLYKRYITELADCKKIIVPFKDRELALSACHIMPIIVKEKYQSLKERLKQKGIQSSCHYTPIPEFTAYQNHDFNSQLSGIHQILTLPLYPQLSEKKVSWICQIIRDFFKVDQDEN